MGEMSPWLIPISTLSLPIKKCSLFPLPLTIGWPSDSFGQQNSPEMTLDQLQDKVSRNLALLHSLPGPCMLLVNRMLLSDEQSHGLGLVGQASGPKWDSRTELSWDDTTPSLTPSCQKTYLLLVEFSHSVMSNSLWPHGLQHTRIPCPSPFSRACSNSCPLSRWCHPTILSSVIPFSSCLQYFPAWGSFLINQLFTSGDQSIGASVSASVLPMNIQDWYPLGLTGWISLQSKRLSRVFSNNTVQKHQFFSTQPSLWYNSHIHTWLLEKP